MIRKAALAAIALALASPALATPPPMPATVVVLSPERAPPGRIEASQALVTALAAENWFDNRPVDVTPAAFAACEATDGGSGGGTEPCIRAVLAKRGAEAGFQSLVAVLVAPGPGSTVIWSCVGEDVSKVRPQQTTAPFDPDLAIDMKGHRDLYLAAANCITAAASEQGW